MEVLNEGGVPLACWCRQQQCLALSFGLLLVSSSSFVLSLIPPFSVLSFIYFLCMNFVGVGIGTVSLHCLACCFFLLVALPTAFVSLLLSILFSCQSLVIAESECTESVYTESEL